MNLKTVILSCLVIIFLVTLPCIPAELSPSDYQKLDPSLALMLNRPELKPMVYQQMTGKEFTSATAKIHVLLKTNLSKTALTKMDLKVTGKIGDIVSAFIPIDQIPDLVAQPDIFYISAPRVVSIHNDESVPEIRATQVRQQYNLTGKGVIIGVIDTGIDWQHPDFRNPDGTTRIKALLELEPGKARGTIYTEQQINNALNGIGSVSQRDRVGHGTHVAGSAAGNGRATGNGIPSGTYIGVAPEADLVIVKANRIEGINFDRNDYIPSLDFIDSVASAMNQSYIINISSGGNLGPHDGTDLSEQAIDNLLTEPNSNCKAVVISAGNDGESDVHASGTFGSGITSIETKFNVPSYTPNPESSDDLITFEGWYGGLYNYSIKVISPSGYTCGPINSGRSTGKATDDGAIYIDNASTGINGYNGDKNIFIYIYDHSEYKKVPKQGIWKIVIVGSAGRFDLWLSGSSMDASISSNIDRTMIVSTPGTAFNAITVGSYITKKRWTDLDGNNLQRPNLIVNSASSFSSPGPTRDGRIKPEISAPGEMIAASYSVDAPPDPSGVSIFTSSSPQWPNAYIAQDGKHGLSQGTSFAAPHVAGTIALMVQQHPNKTPGEIRQSIILTARSDSYTGSVPNDKWGYGKLDALASLQLLSVNDPFSQATVPTSMELHQNYPNPFNPVTLIPYSLDKTSQVQITVFNLLGQKINTLFQGIQNPGAYRIIWDGKDESGRTVPGGIYFFQMTAGSFSQTKKMILLP